MFREGVLVGSYVGASVVWQKITIQSPASGPTSEGRYVLLQMDNNQRMEVYEIVAFGGKIDQIYILLLELPCSYVELFSPSMCIRNISILEV